MTNVQQFATQQVQSATKEHYKSPHQFIWHLYSLYIKKLKTKCLAKLHTKLNHEVFLKTNPLDFLLCRQHEGTASSLLQSHAVRRNSDLSALERSSLVGIHQIPLKCYSWTADPYQTQCTEGSVILQLDNSFTPGLDQREVYPEVFTGEHPGGFLNLGLGAIPP